LKQIFPEKEKINGTAVAVYLFPLQDVFYLIVNTGRKVEMILELPRPPQATQQQQQEADQSLLQLHSSYFYEGIGIQYTIQAVCRFLDRFVAALRI
jgi:hypothetical protein